ncbi:hypothetical protein VKT23_010347 [Stygiomarasmius scandens]|uniref:F-box domain-containing protein n=1 Tax=Marasmiellus scandens TaxID=2682957 RepID=A0ABR1JE20_9AGAR
MSSPFLIHPAFLKKVSGTRRACRAAQKRPLKIMHFAPDADSEKADMSPINRLIPPELLIEIIKHLPMTQLVKISHSPFGVPQSHVGEAIPDHLKKQGVFISIRVPTIQLLNQVCRSWRNVLSSCPELWKTFHLFPRTGKYRHHVEMGQQWLQRAGQQPLDIALTDDLSAGRSPYPPGYYGILDTVIPFSQTWRSLHLSFAVEHYQALFNMPSIRLPHLEQLVLSFSNICDDTTVTSGSIETFANAPRLWRVELISDPSLHLPILDTFRLPYHRLRYLFLQSVYSTDPTFINHILATAPELQSLSIDIGYDTDFSPDDYETCRKRRPFAECPNLLELEVIGRGLFGPGFVLEGLTAPSLQELTLSYDTGEHDPADKLDHVLEAFQKRSRAPIRVLHLRYVENLSDIGLIPFLKLVGRSLRELALHSCWDLDIMGLLEAMIHPWDLIQIDGKPTELLIPNLRRLGIAAVFEHTGDADIIVDVLGSRGHKLPRPRPYLRSLSSGIRYRFRDWIQTHRLKELKFVLIRKGMTQMARAMLDYYAQEDESCCLVYDYQRMASPDSNYFDDFEVPPSELLEDDELDVDQIDGYEPEVTSLVKTLNELASRT